MGDLIYYSTSGFYAFAGVGAFSRSNSGVIEYQDPYSGDWMKIQFKWDEYAGGVGSAGSVNAFALGLGYYFTDNIGIEIRQTSTDASWIQVSLAIRF
jgi:hypothetical protein